MNQVLLFFLLLTLDNFVFEFKRFQFNTQKPIQFVHVSRLRVGDVSVKLFSFFRCVASYYSNSRWTYP